MTALPSPTASPASIVAREETPRLLLSIPYAPPTADKLGATTGRVGGITPRGPSSLAVDENERVYIWDQARLRVVVYGAGKFERAIPLPYVEREAGALLVDGGRIYLRGVSQFGVLEYEIDGATGALLRAVSSLDSIYPRRRAGPQPAGVRSTFGADAAGLEYLYVTLSGGPISRYERMDSGLRTLAYAVEPLPQEMVDAYPRADGALYELAADSGGVGSVYVYALLAPASSIRPSARPTASPTAPVAFGRAVPDRLTATLPGAGSIDLDAPSRTWVWRLASLVNERPDLAAAPHDPLLVARWNDGSKLELVVSDGLLLVEGKTYVGPATTYEQFAAYALASPARLAEIATRGATVRIADLKGVQRALTTPEIADLRASLSNGFAVSEGELPGVLELPFPLYEIVLGDIVIRLRGDDYGSVGQQFRPGAFVHDGKLDDLARRWLPVPALAVDDPRSLFYADKATFEQPGYSDLQDISRWRASLVRALNAEPGPAGSLELDAEPPATLVFRFAGGRVETVVVRPGSFTYRGKVIALRGVMYLVYYRGVP
ncbi:MAG: hypothetical protein AABM40_12410 [Chloroflexota bacterium]